MHNQSEVTAVKEGRKRFMKPDRNKDIPLDDLFKPFLVKSRYGFPYTVTNSKAKMYSNDKNLWIIGTEDRLEDFIHKAIGNSWTHVYNNDNKHKKYFNENSFFIICNKKRKTITIAQIATVPFKRAANIPVIYKQENNIIFACFFIQITFYY